MTIEALTIDGYDFTEDLQDRDEFSLQIERDSTSSVVNLGLTNSIVVIGACYQYLTNKFYLNCSGDGLSSMVRIIVDCCDTELVFELKSEGVGFNSKDCEATLTLLTISEALKKYNKLRSRTWWQNEFVRKAYHPKIKYIDKPNFWQRVTGGSRDWGGSKYHSFHICPKMHPIIEHNASLVGLSFQSQSIFDQYSEYKQLGLVLSQLREGLSVEDDGLSTDPNWRDEIAPVETTVELLNNLAPLFNARVEITSDTLLFEQEEWWRQNAVIIMNLDEEIAKDTIGTFNGFQADPNKNYAFARLQYADDQADLASRRVKWIFSDIIEWNPSGDPSLKGSLEVVAPYSLPHCVGDQGYYEFLRSGGEGALALRQIWGDLIGTPADPFGNAWESGDQYFADRHILFINDGISQNPKIILIPRDEDPELGGVPQPGSHLPPKYVEQPSGVDIYGEPLETTNLPFIIDYPGGFPHIANICQELSFREDQEKGLYKRFYQKVSTQNQRNYLIPEVEWFPEDFCSAFNAIMANGLRIGVTTTFGTALAESINIDFNEKKINFINLSTVRKCE